MFCGERHCNPSFGNFGLVGLKMWRIKYWNVMSLNQEMLGDWRSETKTEEEEKSGLRGLSVVSFS